MDVDTPQEAGSSRTGGEPLRAASPASAERGMDIAEAKKALSSFYRVPVCNIEIVIRG